MRLEINMRWESLVKLASQKPALFYGNFMQGMYRKRFSVGLVLLAPLLLAGCGSEEFQDLRDFVKNSGADMRGKIEPPPEVKPYEHFAYANDTNLPDPFKPRKPEKRAGGGGINQPDLDRHKEALDEVTLGNI